MEISAYKPYGDPEFESLIERIHPPRVCIDNDSCRDCTIVKVDSANKHGILLEMVQVLTDLDLVISKSYICSDGGWLMDVFHVTDQLGNKITDESLIHYIEEAICASRRGSREVQTCVDRNVRARHVSMEHMAMEMTGIDRPGLMSEISAVLAELGCHVSAAVAWTHNKRAACIVYVEDELKHGPIQDPYRVAQVQAQLENVVEAHHYDGERRSVRLAAPAASQTHTERRLHQLMAADRDYEQCCSCDYESSADDEVYRQKKGCNGTEVKVENCRQKGYSIVTVRSVDRPKLLFDTICTLTDLQYVVFHASISSFESIAIQEYYVRHKNGWTLDSESERRRLTQNLMAATERRVSHGLRLDVSTQNRVGLLSDVTRVFRENGLSISRAEIGIQGEKAVGTFYVKDASGQAVNPETLETVRREIGGTVLVVNKSLGKSTSQPTSSSNTSPSVSTSHSSSKQDKPGFSLGSLLWSQVEWLSSNFRPIKS
ncbi:PREDICTED: ACT domain-containing protein ACR1 [Nicotiana attenuata]|uniref:ACT domain-containing protein ACR n=1 Tax=Nicotiana attenuata TaxID=49451 RepID=A0A1J6KA41_NICAT|nr:PREDICTED: ACT domain-containing protein ACR1 [Nicotiana attenuata]XP_019238263.1 PREDICTED: ACT domain-containing protein ACR1 [Nicotiana attenuata]XP_019238264.1 PREDICTED: ACT domain-containing protein ACR1 [Nicotiana attenuata]XP_019238265.1 PREDICTED: ACT domain-containing protein ACR1 [Nicotiana attenuata]OIT21856.1 act domain-containing protein acr1 [Nicotiana attenuata]